MDPAPSIYGNAVDPTAPFLLVPAEHELLVVAHHLALDGQSIDAFADPARRSTNAFAARAGTGRLRWRCAGSRRRPPAAAYH